MACTTIGNKVVEWRSKKRFCRQ